MIDSKEEIHVRVKDITIKVVVHKSKLYHCLLVIIHSTGRVR
jgi:hypothetical protein